MKLLLEPTDRIESVQGVPHRVWRGFSDEGVEVLAWCSADWPAKWPRPKTGMRSEQHRRRVCTLGETRRASRAVLTARRG